MRQPEHDRRFVQLGITGLEAVMVLLAAGRLQSLDLAVLLALAGRMNLSTNRAYGTAKGLAECVGRHERAVANSCLRLRRAGLVIRCHDGTGGCAGRYWMIHPALATAGGHSRRQLHQARFWDQLPGKEPTDPMELAEDLLLGPAPEDSPRRWESRPIARVRRYDVRPSAGPLPPGVSRRARWSWGNALPGPWRVQPISGRTEPLGQEQESTEPVAAV